MAYHVLLEYPIIQKQACMSCISFRDLFGVLLSEPGISHSGSNVINAFSCLSLRVQGEKAPEAPFKKKERRSLYFRLVEGINEAN